MPLDQIKERAESSFKRKEQQDARAAKAWTEYQARQAKIDEKTERLRALRIARDTVPLQKEKA
jgi:hypothetical protein